MNNGPVRLAKIESRIIPEEVPVRFYAQQLKAYEHIKKDVVGKKVLDVGCGDGYGSAYLAEAATGVTGIDYDESIILKATNKYKVPNLNFKYMSATELEFENNSFDVVCSFQVIEHISEEKLQKYLSEIKRVLTSNGKFYVTTLNLNHNMKSPLNYLKNPAHCKEFRLWEFQELLCSVFPDVEILGIHLTTKHRFFQRLKKSGVFRFIPQFLNPVDKFYDRVTVKDFKVTKYSLKKAFDFIGICRQ